MLEHQYASQDEIPEAYRDLYTEKAGKWEITGINGLKSQADVERLNGALAKEREAHKATKSKVAVWDGFDHDDIMKKLDRLPELEAAAKGKLDEAAIEKIVSDRVDGTLRSRLAPVERQLKTVLTERDALKAENSEFLVERTKRQLGDTLRPHMLSAKVRPEHYDDVTMYANAHFERTEDGTFVTRDKVGVTPGLDVKGWLEEMLSKRPGWVPGSVGGGARGSGAPAGGISDNPWSSKNWNKTAQGQFVKTHGMEKAKQAAASAGVDVLASKPRDEK